MARQLGSARSIAESPTVATGYLRSQPWATIAAASARAHRSWATAPHRGIAIFTSSRRTVAANGPTTASAKPGASMVSD